MHLDFRLPTQPAEIGKALCTKTALVEPCLDFVLSMNLPNLHIKTLEFGWWRIPIATFLLDVHISLNFDIATPQIETLKLGWCKIGGNDGAKSIADLLMFNQSLVTLDLRGNGLGNSGAAAIAGGLRGHENENLTELDLGYNEIKDDGACSVAQVRYCLRRMALEVVTSANIDTGI